MPGATPRSLRLSRHAKVANQVGRNHPTVARGNSRIGLAGKRRVQVGDGAPAEGDLMLHKIMKVQFCFNFITFEYVLYRQKVFPESVRSMFFK